MTIDEAIAYFTKTNEGIVLAAKDENVYNYEKQRIIAVCMRRTFEANKMAIASLEAWEKCVRNVVGFEGIYNVDIYGNVTNIQTQKMLKSHLNDEGYLIVCLTKERNTYTKKVHRIVAEAFIQNPQKKKCVNHIDGNKTNNNVWNLEWCTHKENNIHAGETGLKRNAIRIRVIETGEIFNSLGSCARAINGHEATLSRCIRNNKTYFGFHFEVLNNPLLENDYLYIDKHLQEVGNGQAE